MVYVAIKKSPQGQNLAGFCIGDALQR